jgi:hypothetical protein
MTEVGSGGEGDGERPSSANTAELRVQRVDREKRLGGLTTSTLITLVFIPILYTLVEERSERKARSRLVAPESGTQPIPAEQ